jgi:anti-sigma factor RsiW
VSCELVDRHLDSYVDRELDLESAKAVGEHLKVCVVCRRRVAERESLGRLVQSAPYYPAPDRLRAQVAAGAGQVKPRRRLFAWAAAAVVVLAVGGGLSLLQSDRGSDTALIDEVIDGHVRSLMADHLFDVQSTDQHTVKPWFLGKLDFSPPVSDLASIGYPLVGGRLEYLGGHPAAALVYERRRHTINVFVSPEHEGAADPATATSVRGFHVHHWVHGGMSYWAVSDLNDAELIEFVRALQAG